MHKVIPAVMIAGLMLTGCARQSRVESTGEVDLSATPVDARSLPGGTSINVSLDREIGTKVSKVGDTFTATVENAIVAQNGATVVPAGSKVHGKVTGVDNSDRVGDAAVIKIDFERLTVNGRDHPFNAKVTATNLQTRGGDTRSETIRKAGVGAAALLPPKVAPAAATTRPETMGRIAKRLTGLAARRIMGRSACVVMAR